MQIAIRTIGNSKGIVLPKPLLAQVGLNEESSAHLTVEDGAIVLRKLKCPVRQGWAEQTQAIAARGEDELVMGEFTNADDARLVW